MLRFSLSRWWALSFAPRNCLLLSQDGLFCFDSFFFLLDIQLLKMRGNMILLKHFATKFKSRIEKAERGAPMMLVSV
jgi:hypothetical protein